MAIDTGVLDKSDTLIWVRPDSNVPGIAGAVRAMIKTKGRATLRAIGAGAVNQAVKGSIQARQQFANEGEDMITRNGFQTVKGHDDSDVTSIVINCSLL